MTVRTQLLDPASLRRFSVATAGDLDVEAWRPALAHWAWFPDMVAAEDIGADGHPAPGRVLPDTGKARRMFASAQIDFLAPLRLGVEAQMRETVTDQRVRPGSGGDLTLMDIERVISQGGADRVVEKRTLVFLDPGPPVSLPEVTETDANWCPGPVELFRFSAATFNAHRIHYDLDYARSVEGYPERVVHGPLTAARLAAMAAWKGTLSSFSFRAKAPLFASQPVRLEVDDDGSCRAVRCDGVVAMDAKAIWGTYV